MAPDDRIALARQLFALITMELEDALTLAVDGQGPVAEHRKLAERLVQYGEEMTLLARAVALILG